MKFLKSLRAPSWRLPLSALAITCANCSVAYAQTTDLPWVGPLQSLQASLTGPVAKAIGVIALGASGATLAFGGEMSDFTKRIMMVVLALSVMILANTFVNIIH